MSFQKFPSIDQFRECIKEVSQHVRYRGRDENGKSIYDHSYKLPTFEFEGTVKLHGTNASVARRGKGELWVQSRNRVITLESDNAGFCAFVLKNKQVFNNLFDQVEGVGENDIVTIFGEWCGQGIQKNVAIAALPKMFVIFGVKIGEGENETWLPSEKLSKILNLANSAPVYNIYSFPTYSISIDFNDPEASQQQLESLTDSVEKECPVAAKFGSKGIGEGIVWTGRFNDTIYRFKVKGDEHSVTKTKSAAATKPEIQASLAEFVKNVVTKQRCEQGIQEVFTTQNKKATLSETGAFVRWIISDVMKEETDTMEASGLVKEDCNKAITDAARTWFKKYCFCEKSSVAAAPSIDTKLNENDDDF